MQGFISLVVDQIISENATHDLANTKIVLPSKRAGVFFKDTFKKQLNPYTFLPEIISIDDFIEEISEISLISSVEILFEFYTIYKNSTPKNKVIDFEDFISWSAVLLQDINEIDRHLINADYLFEYLADIHRIEKWFLKHEKETQLTKNYLSFFTSFKKYYQQLYKHLLAQKKGYQGLQYREAVHQLTNYIKNTKNQKFVFVGFNALNKAEEQIIKTLLDEQIAEIYFDIDAYFIEQKSPYASFINQYKDNWNYFKKNPFTFISNEFKKEKNIHIIGAPKNVTLIKQTGTLLKEISTTSSNFENVALVLANENFLSPVLSTLPKEIEKVNITMGYPLKNIELSNLIQHIFKLYLNKEKLSDQGTFYYKDILPILNHPNLTNYFIAKKITVQPLIANIVANNYTFITHSELKKIAPQKKGIQTIVDLLFFNYKDVEQFIKNVLKLISALQSAENSILDTEYLIRFKKLFEQLKTVYAKYGYMNTLRSLQAVYKQLLHNESLSFKGEPLTGLQIMGMLETRLLDFETVILTSVNEGFIPSGRTANSFIPLDVKREFNIPTHQEKDAIFSYHFYRLLQRAKNIYLLYNTETDDFGSGEQSRFITQLEIFSKDIPEHRISKSIISPQLKNTPKETLTIQKTTLLKNKLQELAKKGLSPTTLTNYVYDPITFYKQKILGVKELNTIEETVAANTLGTIIHKTLEALYKPYINTYITPEDITSMQKKAENVLINHFEMLFKKGDIYTGKNLLIFEIAKQYMRSFLQQELTLLKKGGELKILALEEDFDINIRIEGIDFPIKLTGQADRIDQLNGVIRIIDYKTGKVQTSDLNLKKWEELRSNHKKYSKSFQVLMYAYMFCKTHTISLEESAIESGVISFKNLKAGFMKINKEQLNHNILTAFETELKYLITEIYNADIPFVENENPNY